MSKSMLYHCPHCREPAHARQVREVTPLQRAMLFQCPDPECGHTFEVRAEVAYTTTPSAMPDPSIAEQLRVYARTRRAPGALHGSKP